jgi:hypothetical protein
MLTSTSIRQFIALGIIAPSIACTCISIFYSQQFVKGEILRNIEKAIEADITIADKKPNPDSK